MHERGDAGQRQAGQFGERAIEQIEMPDSSAARIRPG